MSIVVATAPGTRPGAPKGARRWAAVLLTKHPNLFVAVFAAWFGALAWFHPRMWSLTEAAQGPLSYASIVYFVVFAELAWLYGFYNLAIVIFARLHKSATADRHQRFARCAEAAAPSQLPAIAVLYTTCNDFVERSAQSCVDLNYPNFSVYILDDSSDPAARARIDTFAAKHLERVIVVRRPVQTGFKAGNLNYALSKVAHEPYFAVVDADEVLPPDFLAKLTPRMLAIPQCGFIQANHRSRPDARSGLARDMGIGVDIHWKWYQPLRNDLGFVMFLGHGALLRRSCWEIVGGFPEIVSEDLAYAIAIRTHGFKGLFAEDVVCMEEFPESVRAFRIRHVKWTRGTCEFLKLWGAKLIGAKNITLAEKLDILFPTLNLPMTFFFFLFMINAQFLFPLVLGEVRPLTFVLSGAEFVVPTLSMNEEMARIFGVDFYLITLLTIVAPILCFILHLWRQPLRLARFLAHSTALYAALTPLTFVSVIGYALTGKARFHVTGDTGANGNSRTRGLPLHQRVNQWLIETHPDSGALRALEISMGFAFLCCATIGFQVSFFGLASAFILLPLMHSVRWRNPLVRIAVWLPFAMTIAGLFLGTLGVAGLQPVFFGYGFHF